MRAPRFWAAGGERGAAALLAPAGWLYGWSTRLRLAMFKPWRAPVPVICAGNLTAGGSGKTPVALEIVRRLTARGARPHVLTRGYGGREAGPLRVDPARHDAAAVGDEALLLAAVAPTWVARDRARGAAAAAAGGAGVIVMDDGLQNPGLVKDLSLVVIDGGFGFGNGLLIPAGPLRESIEAGLARADAVAVIGEDTAGVTARVAAATRNRLPILAVRAAPAADAVTRLAGRRVVAFAGIARPERFFATLEAIGCTIVARFAFADHHPFTPEELAAIRAAAGDDALPVTTAKDAARLPPAWRQRAAVLPIELTFADPEALEALLSAALERR